MIGFIIMFGLIGIAFSEGSYWWLIAGVALAGYIHEYPKKGKVLGGFFVLMLTTEHPIIGIGLAILGIAYLYYRIKRTNFGGNLFGTRRKRYPTQDMKHQVFRRDNGRCQKCGSTTNLQYDHIVPYSKGGKTTVRNLQLLCKDCNQKKGNKNFGF